MTEPGRPVVSMNWPLLPWVCPKYFQKIILRIFHDVFFFLKPPGVYDSLAYSIYRTSGAECRDIVEEAFEEAERLIDADDADSLQELFNLCDPIDTDSPNDVSSFFQNAYDLLVEYVQQQQWVRVSECQKHLKANELKFSSGRGIENMCDDIEESDLEPLEAFARWVRFVMGDECYDADYNSKIAQRSNTSWDQIGTLSGRKSNLMGSNDFVSLKILFGRSPMELYSMHPSRFVPDHRWLDMVAKPGWTSVPSCRLPGCIRPRVMRLHLTISNHFLNKNSFRFQLHIRLNSSSTRNNEKPIRITVLEIVQNNLHQWWSWSENVQWNRLHRRSRIRCHCHSR